MLDVKKIFGVGINEEFKINEIPNSSFMFTVHGLLEYSVLGSRDAADVLQKLIIGEYTIKKKPFRANKGDTYYTPLMDNKSKDSIVIKEVTYKNTNGDSLYYTCGLMCETEKQAKELGRLLIKTARNFQGFDTNG